MHSKNWKQIEEIFQAALEQAPEDREAYLKKTCKNDAGLKQEVQSLLKSHEQAGSFLESANPPLASEENKDDIIGKQIGAYRVESQIGHGGMGNVYLAVRDDEAFQSQVAIKLIRRGMDTEDMLKRFRSERQTLANLKHPNISRLLDGGSTEESLPYFIMEYIDGEPIDKFCDVKKLSITERLNLFRKVCAAVHYAHQNLVIHRDLKPSNILVTGDGDVKLLDFGIAKILKPDIDLQTVTKAQHQIVTPGYASPEQIRGDIMTTASDVYSLGILLYSLLTGHQPYQFNNLNFYEIEKVICETEPLKPSTVVLRSAGATSSDGTKTTLNPEVNSGFRKSSPEKLRRKLTGELDNIILMALRKEPHRRYTSAEQFSEDIKRHLDGLPIIAHKDSLGYRSAKFIKRHSVAVTAATIIVLLLISAVVGINWQAQRARSEAAKAQQIVTYVKEMLSIIDPYESGKKITVAELLDEATKRIETELQDQPEIEAEVRTILGGTYQNLGLYDQAEPHLQKALELYRRIHGEKHAMTARGLRDMALLRHYQGKYDEAEPFYQQAIDINRKLENMRSREFGHALNDYGLLLMDEAKYEESEIFLREALSVFREISGNKDDDVATAINNLAVVLHWQGELDEAAKLYQESLDINHVLYGSQHIYIAKNLNNLGLVVLDRGDTLKAADFFRKSLDMRRQLMGDEHQDVALATHNLAGITYHLRDYATAEKLQRKALTLWQKLLPAEHPDLAKALNKLGLILQAQKQYDEALNALKSAVDIRRKVYEPENHLLASAEIDLGKCLTEIKQFRKAELLLLDVQSRSQKQNEKNAQKALKALVDLYSLWNKPGKAAEYRAQLLQITAN